LKAQVPIDIGERILDIRRNRRIGFQCHQSWQNYIGVKLAMDSGDMP